MKERFRQVANQYSEPTRLRVGLALGAIRNIAVGDQIVVFFWRIVKMSADLAGNRGIQFEGILAAR
jgi:hypothetical protein